MSLPEDEKSLDLGANQCWSKRCIVRIVIGKEPDQIRAEIESYCESFQVGTAVCCVQPINLNGNCILPLLAGESNVPWRQFGLVDSIHRRPGNTADQDNNQKGFHRSIVFLVIFVPSCSWTWGWYLFSRHAELSLEINKREKQSRERSDSDKNARSTMPADATTWTDEVIVFCFHG